MRNTARNAVTIRAQSVVRVAAQTAIAAALIAAAVPSSAQTPPQNDHRLPGSSQSRTQAPASMPTPQPGDQVQAAPQSLSPAQKMPSPPRIAYTSGKLTVTANNSTLREVLDGIHAAVGTNVDVQGGSLDSRVFGEFGPATPYAVMQQVLRGSGVGYILIAPPTDPGAVQSVIVTANASQPVVSADGVQPVARMQQPPPNQAENAPDNDNSDENSEPAPEPAQINQNDQQQDQQQQQQQPQPGVVTNPNQQQPNGAAQPKSPEQLLQELQQLQKQRQQNNNGPGPR